MATLKKNPTFLCEKNPISYNQSVTLRDKIARGILGDQLKLLLNMWQLRSLISFTYYWGVGFLFEFGLQRFLWVTPKRIDLIVLQLFFKRGKHIGRIAWGWVRFRRRHRRRGAIWVREGGAVGPIWVPQLARAHVLGVARLDVEMCHYVDRIFRRVG